MLEARNVTCVRGDKTVFSDINFTISPGSLLQVQGPNGSGKTSLLRIICGLLEPETGEIRWEGSKIRDLGEDYYRNLAYVGHRNGIKEELNALENLQISSGLSGQQLDHRQAQNSLERVGLSGREHLAARFLSEGQRRRAALARLLEGDPVLWVLDEVLASLDSAAVNLMQVMLEEHLEKGGIAVVATHQELNVSGGSFQRLELL